MAIYHFKIGHIGRSAGRSATAAAAYRAGLEIVDARTGERHDYRHRSGVLDHAILTPRRTPDWAKESARLWNAAEQAEQRKDSRVARENIVALPHELTLEQNRTMLHRFVKDNYVKRGMAAQVDIHGADAQGDQRNIHAHILLTPRPLTRHGFKAQKPQSWNAKETLAQWRENWAQCVNQALERHGFKERIDARTLQAQGIVREATQHCGPAVTAMERRGQSTRAGGHNRAVERGNRERAGLAQQHATVEANLAAEQARPRAAPYRLKLDLARDFEAGQRQARAVLEAKLEAFYQRQDVQAALEEARAKQQGADNWWGRLSGRYEKQAEQVKALERNLANIDQRQGEQRDALKAKQAAERREFYGLQEPEPTPTRQAGPAFNREAPPQGPPDSPAQEQAQDARRAALVEKFRQAREKARERGREDGPELER